MSRPARQTEDRGGLPALDLDGPRLSTHSAGTLRIQLWSYNYDPEPIGIAPVATTWARAMRDRGHDVDVVAAHPHYPAPQWRTGALPYREIRDGIPVLRLPLIAGRDKPARRLVQELSFTAAQTLALGALRTPDVMVVISPSFPALLPAMINARFRGIPWVLWIHDILPDGAVSIGLIQSPAVLAAARWLERRAYDSADHIVVISKTFEQNLRRKGVRAEKLTHLYNFITRSASASPNGRRPAQPPCILSMGNIGHSQGLDMVIRAFEGSEEVAATGATLVVTGDGVAAETVRSAIATDRTRMLGVVSNVELERQLQSATLALVSQRPDISEFNLPSKLMNFMAYGVPVVACVAPDSETARIVRESGAGWVIDSSRPEEFGPEVAAAIESPEECAQRGQAGARFAEQHFLPDRLAEQFDSLLRRVVTQATPGQRAS
jgi:colanic acid biosynthesis glycosyl transferase WcaI